MGVGALEGVRGGGASEGQTPARTQKCRRPIRVSRPSSFARMNSTGCAVHRRLPTCEQYKMCSSSFAVALVSLAMGWGSFFFCTDQGCLCNAVLIEHVRHQARLC